MPPTNEKATATQATPVEVPNEQEAPIAVAASNPEEPSLKPANFSEAIEQIPINTSNNADLTTSKTPNVTLRHTNSQSTASGSQQTTANNTPTLTQDATFVPKPITPAGRTNSSFAIKNSPKIQGISRTFTTGVTKVGGHKLWEHNHNHDEGETQWGVNWYMPSHMAFLGLAGAAGAIGHHFYNTKLHGTVVHNSDWTQRWGLALAFFIKFCLVGAVQIAYKQTVWLTLKGKLLRVRTIDSLFAACQDPLEFFNTEFILKAFIPALLAGLVWLLPLCAIAAPASLTSVAMVTNATVNCDFIPSLNFSREPTLEFTSDKENMCFWDNRDDGLPYYNSPSDHMIKISTIELLIGKGATQPLNPCSGYNCTYNITFNSPTFKCVEMPDFDVPTNRSINKDWLIPNGNLSYIGLSSIEEDDFGRPISWQNESQTGPNGGVLVEPDFWVGTVFNTTDPLEEPFVNTAGLVWNHNITTIIRKCSLFTSDQTFQMSWGNDGVMIVNGWTRENWQPMISWSPEDPDYKILSGFHAAAFLMRKQLSGTMGWIGGDEGYPTTDSGVSQTDLLGEYLMPRLDFGTEIEFEFVETIISIASDPLMQAVQPVNTTCHVNKPELLWNYRPLWLVLSYSLAVAGMLCAVIMGVFAYKWNGYGTDLSFSSILVTTRNKALDDVSDGSCLGNTPLPKHITQERLRFGELTNARASERQDGPKHTGFGFAWQAGPITKGEKYA